MRLALSSVVLYSNVKFVEFVGQAHVQKYFLISRNYKYPSKGNKNSTVLYCTVVDVDVMLIAYNVPLSFIENMKLRVKNIWNKYVLTHN